MREKFESKEIMNKLVVKTKKALDEIENFESAKEMKKNDVALLVYEIENKFDSFNEIDKAYKNIKEFLMTKFAMSSTTVKNYRAVGKFLSSEKNKAYLNYGFSALVEMLPLIKKESKLLDSISESTPAKEIRRMKKAETESNNESPKKAKTKKEIKLELEKMLTVNDLNTIKNMIKNLKDEL
jgi:hypothetical protein